MELLRGRVYYVWMFNENYGNFVSVFLDSFSNVPNITTFLDSLVSPKKLLHLFANFLPLLNCRIPLKTSAFTCKINKETLCKLVQFYNIQTEMLQN